MGMRGSSALSAAFLLLMGAPFAGACGSADSTSDIPDGDGCGRVVESDRDVIPDPPDGASLCPSGACNYQSQAGCSGGTTCVPIINASNQITPSCETVGTREPGEVCTNLNDCTAGYACAEGQCRKLCCGRDWSESTCDPGEGCFREWFFLLSGVVLPTGAYLCYPTGCDVLSSDDCPSARDCKIIDPVGTTACVPPSAGARGDRCTPPEVCGRGLSCVGQPGDANLPEALPCGRMRRTRLRFRRDLRALQPDPEGVGECTPGWPDP